MPQYYKLTHCKSFFLLIFLLSFLFRRAAQIAHPTPVLLFGKSHGWRSLVGCSPWGREQSDTTERLHFHFLLACIGEGNGNPLQCSCLENPRDGGAWWAAIYGVTQSWTRVKRLSSCSSNPDSSVCKESTCNAGGPSSIPRLGISAGERIYYPLQYSWAALWLNW